MRAQLVTVRVNAAATATTNRTAGGASAAPAMCRRRWAVDRAIVGDDEPVAMADRPRVRAIVESTDPAEQTRAAARLGAETLFRLYPIYRAFEQAAATDAELRAHWREYQTRRYADTARIVAALPALRPGLTRERATETIWALLTWHPVALLVEERGWTQDQLVEWLEDMLSTIVS